MQIIPPPRTLQEYNDREFLSEDVQFSSFTYLIDIGHSLAASLALGPHRRDPLAPELISADVRLMNWMSYLPERKRLITAVDGGIDELMFQAHLCYHV